MNTPNLSVLRFNAARYLRGNLIFCSWTLLVIWVASMFFLYRSETATTLSTLYILLFAYFFSSYFWLYGWSVGNVDIFTTFHLGKHKNDRRYISLMSCLPLDRGMHYYLQVLLYSGVCAVICITSLVLQMVSEFSRTHFPLMAATHLVIYALLIFAGGLQTVLNFPFAFRGDVTSFKHPIAITGWLSLIPFLLFVFSVYYRETLTRNYEIKNFFYFFLAHPVIPLLLMVAGALLFLLGGYIFKSTDIR